MAFELAHFSIQDRDAAKGILLRALEKLRVHSRRETKRLYWRDKHSERAIRRVIRRDLEMLQWLVMSEAEAEERTQESSGEISEEHMIVRFIKYIVQITSPFSSFYVNIGISRFIHNYSTLEAQHIFELLTARYPGSDEYRRAKSYIMERLLKRFDGFLIPARAQHGELRLTTAENQSRYSSLVDKCLRRFAAWNRESLSDQQSTERAEVEILLDSDPNEKELNICWAITYPESYSQLAKTLGLDAPDTKLSLPQFSMPDMQNNKQDRNTPQHPIKLSESEINDVQRQLALCDARRRKLNPEFVKIVIDGVESGRLVLNSATQRQIALPTGAVLVEIYGNDHIGEVLLATHFLAVEDADTKSGSAAAKLGNGKLTFHLIPLLTGISEITHGILTIDFVPRFNFGSLGAFIRAFVESRQQVRAFVYGALAAALCIWSILSVYYGQKLHVLNQEIKQVHSKQPLQPTAAQAMVSYTLIRDENVVRSQSGGEFPEISLRLKPAALNLTLSPSEARSDREYLAELSTFDGSRVLMTQNNIHLSPDTSVIELIVPANLLKEGTYYTVSVRSGDRIDRFSFKVRLD